jgi:deoxyribodipyrimidine photo-lyase
MASPVNIFWFRRDLRLNDNHGLFQALQSGKPVVPIFIFDRNILDQLEHRHDARVEFIHQQISAIQEQLVTRGSTLHVMYGKPEEVFASLLNTYQISDVFTNTDYEPYAIHRDAAIAELLAKHNVGFQAFKDQVIFEKKEVVKDDGSPYTVFTPYSKRWRALWDKQPPVKFPSEKKLEALHQQAVIPVPSLESMGFKTAGITFPPDQVKDELIKHYSTNRDFPGIPGTSRLGVHLRFGTISIRDLALHTQTLNITFLNELIWREFYHMILWNFPRVGEGKSFKPAYDQIEWRNNEEEFARWCEGNTGYPIVDAGMRELNTTGYMHNRVRMIVASFLCKHLLIDWRWGEAYFAEKLLDFDFAANNGGWQWASGSGCDAAPYFRIFNPYLQTEKFDKGLSYIKHWVPEFQEFTYPRPVVEHEYARKRCLEVYTKAVGTPKTT